MKTFRGKLQASFFVCLLLPLSIVYLGYSYYEARSRLNLTSQQLDDSLRSLLMSHQLQTGLLTVDQRNPAFFETGRSRFLDQHEINLHLIRQNLAEIAHQLTSQSLPMVAQIRALERGLDAYESQLQAIVRLLRERGFEDYGLVGTMRASIHDLESQPEMQQSTLMVHLLSLRRHEKDYIIRNRARYADDLLTRSDLLINTLEQSAAISPGRQLELIGLVKDYRRHFTDLVSMDQRIGHRDYTALYQQLKSTEERQQQLFENLRQQFERLQNKNLNELRHAIFVTIAGLLLLIIFLSLYLAQKLTAPLAGLSRYIEAFVDNKFVPSGEPPPGMTNKDETGQLARDFSHLQTSIVQQLENIKAQEQAAQEANLAKSRFLAHISHELRTPLNGIIGIAQLLDTHTLPGPQQEYAGMIQSSALNLQQLIGDVLDFSKIEAREVALEHMPFDLLASCQGACDGVRFLAGEKGLTFTLDTSNANQKLVTGDHVKWRQVVSNLLNNALKFTVNGGIAVRLSTVPDGDQHRIILAVKDTGIGIDITQHQHIFDAFKQADNSTTRHYGGTGLGLAISRELAHLMQGEITVASSLGEGSTFTFTALLAPAEHLPEHIPVRPAGSSLHILVAEDVKLNQIIARRMLERLGCSVDIAENGLQAVDKVRHSHMPYDLVLMDVQMPILDGLQAARLISTLENPAPVIALTANATQTDRQACLNAGMVDFITKPLALNRLAQLINSHSARATTAKPLPQTPATLC